MPYAHLNLPLKVMATVYIAFPVIYTRRPLPHSPLQSQTFPPITSTIQSSLSGKQGDVVSGSSVSSIYGKYPAITGSTCHYGQDNMPEAWKTNSTEQDLRASNFSQSEVN